VSAVCRPHSRPVAIILLATRTESRRDYDGNVKQACLELAEAWDSQSCSILRLVPRPT
jgi:hypothetical protein